MQYNFYKLVEALNSAFSGDDDKNVEFSSHISDYDEKKYSREIKKNLLAKYKDSDRESIKNRINDQRMYVKRLYDDYKKEKEKYDELKNEYKKYKTKAKGNYKEFGKKIKNLPGRFKKINEYTSLMKETINSEEFNRRLKTMFSTAFDINVTFLQVIENSVKYNDGIRFLKNISFIPNTNNKEMLKIFNNKRSTKQNRMMKLKDIITNEKLSNFSNIIANLLRKFLPKDVNLEIDIVLKNQYFSEEFNPLIGIYINIID